MAVGIFPDVRSALVLITGSLKRDAESKGARR